jgi:hypothetical protein
MIRFFFYHWSGTYEPGRRRWPGVKVGVVVWCGVRAQFGGVVVLVLTTYEAHAMTSRGGRKPTCQPTRRRDEWRLAARRHADVESSRCRRMGGWPSMSCQLTNGRARHVSLPGSGCTTTSAYFSNPNMPFLLIIARRSILCSFTHLLHLDRSSLIPDTTPPSKQCHTRMYALDRSSHHSFLLSLSVSLPVSGPYPLCSRGEL